MALVLIQVLNSHIVFFSLMQSIQPMYFISLILEIQFFLILLNFILLLLLIYLLYDFFYFNLFIYQVLYSLIPH